MDWIIDEDDEGEEESRNGYLKVDGRWNIGVENVYLLSWAVCHKRSPALWEREDQGKDIKPENIVIDYPILTDFGISTHFEGREVHSQGPMAKTAKYAEPEATFEKIRNPLNLTMRVPWDSGAAWDSASTGIRCCKLCYKIRTWDWKECTEHQHGVGFCNSRSSSAWCGENGEYCVNQFCSTWLVSTKSLDHLLQIFDVRPKFKNGLGQRRKPVTDMFVFDVLNPQVGSSCLLWC